MKKRILSLLMAVALAIGMLPAMAWATGTPIEIKTAEDLSKVTGSNDYVLMNDIELSGAWTPISNVSLVSDAFAGTFDGNGHTISGLNGSNGLFGFVNGATIKNLKVEGTISGTSANVGGIVGKTQTGTRIENCTFAGNIKSTSTGSSAGVGGIVGKVNTGSLTITNCYNTANVTSGKNAGGILGYSSAAGTKITNSFNTGTISGASASGGIVGSMTNRNSSVSNSYWTQPDTGKGIGSGSINDGKVDSIASVVDKLGDAFTTDASGNVILKWEASSTPVEKNPHIVISGDSSLYMTNSGTQPQTTLTVEYKDMDDTPTVTWTADNDYVTLEQPKMPVMQTIR